MTLIDTAEMYGDGAAEKLIGEAIAGRRAEVFLVSKVLPEHATLQGTIEACAKSLRRLQTDYLDLYLLHWRGGVPLSAQEEEEDLPLVGVSLDPKGTAAGSVEIILAGEGPADDRHVEHTIRNVQKIAPLVGVTGVEDGLGFEDQEGGKTLLIFEQLTELPEATA